jgi:hypothetical protein
MATKRKIKDEEPPLWLTALKLILVLAVMIGGVGLALWYAQRMETDAGNGPTSDQWGISHDSPLRMKR